MENLTISASRLQAARIRALLALLALRFRLHGTAKIIFALFIMCLHPIPAWCVGRSDSGKLKLSFKPSSFALTDSPDFVLPCGKCLGCLHRRRDDWCSRLTFESQLHSGSFVTLTYNDKYCPSHLLKSDIQKFLKRFRHLKRDYGISLPSDFRYFVCGEYGSKGKRPHYHALLFGVDFFEESFSPYIATWKENHPIFTSPILQKLWPFGFVSFDQITPANIRYVSKYIIKSALENTDEFTLKSMRLGTSYFFDDVGKSSVSCKYISDYKKGLLHLCGKNGKLTPVVIPKAFDRYFQLSNPLDFEYLKDSRRQFAQTRQTTIEDVRRHQLWLKNTYTAKPTERPLHYG